MFFRNNFYRAAAMGALALFGACTDASLPEPDHVSRNDVAMTRQDKDSPKDGANLKGAARLGDLHNKAITAFRKEMRKPGVLTNNICRYLIGFMRREDVVPTDLQQGQPALAPDKVERVLRDAANCNAGVSTSNVSHPNAVNAPRASAELDRLHDAVVQAIYASASATELAGRLSEISATAAQLSPFEQQALDVSIDVANSSFAYWSVEYATFAQEVGAEYRPCISGYTAQGYDTDAALSACTNMNAVPTQWRMRDGPSARFGFTAFKKPFCSTDPGPDLREIAWADFQGGFSGFFAGAFAGNPIIGALIGAGGGSIATGLKLAFRQYMCIMTT
jgi:hypothetical protein